MLSGDEDMEISALRKRGWSISAIARHVGHDRKTVRGYLSGEREVGVRERAEPDPFDAIEPYVQQRFADDQHVWATVLFDEVVKLGYPRSYPTFTRALRDRGLRPHCEPCSASNGRAHVDIEHPPGEELQWDWLELDDTPWGEKAFVLVGALSCSGRFRPWFSDSDDQAHLVVGIDEVLRRLGGTARRWRVDRMATVINPVTGKVQRSFVPVAKHYGVEGIDPCPPRHGNRKGVVEKSIHYLTQGWWRTARVGSPAEAQASADRWCVEVADARERDGSTVGVLAEAEPLLALPDVPYPAEVLEVRTVATNALISLWGNRYSVPAWPHRRPRADLLASRRRHLRDQGRRRRGVHPPTRTPRRAAHRPAARAHDGPGERGARRVQHRPALQAQGEPAAERRRVGDRRRAARRSRH
jgi:hypothetical protein